MTFRAQFRQKGRVGPPASEAKLWQFNPRPRSTSDAVVGSRDDNQQPLRRSNSDAGLCESARDGGSVPSSRREMTRPRSITGITKEDRPRDVTPRVARTGNGSVRASMPSSRRSLSSSRVPSRMDSCPAPPRKLTQSQVNALVEEMTSQTRGAASTARAVSRASTPARGSSTPARSNTPVFGDTPRATAPGRATTPTRAAIPTRTATPTRAANSTRATTPTPSTTPRGSSCARGGAPGQQNAILGQDKLAPADIAPRQTLKSARALATPPRIRRPSTEVAIVAHEELRSAWEVHTTYHVHGRLSNGQAFGEEREWQSFGFDNGVPAAVSCIKGCKEEPGETKPNQDNFSITHFKNGYSMACCFDGHGCHGHFVSTRTVQTVPYFLLKSPAFPDNMRVALLEAFDRAQKEVVLKATEEGWDVHDSGTTAVAAVWYAGKVWTANVGDSRCVIGSASSHRVLFSTVDHKPELESERARIERSGGEVIGHSYEDGVTIHRVYARGQQLPGLCMSRSLGDMGAKAVGVTATPEITAWDMDPGENPFIVLSTDGVWEFIDSEFVTQSVGTDLQNGNLAQSVQRLKREARKRWEDEDDTYCDDITSIVVPLGNCATRHQCRRRTNMELMASPWPQPRAHKPKVAATLSTCSTAGDDLSDTQSCISSCAS